MFLQSVNFIFFNQILLEPIRWTSKISHDIAAWRITSKLTQYWSHDFWPFPPTKILRKLWKNELLQKYVIAAFMICYVSLFAILRHETRWEMFSTITLHLILCFRCVLLYLPLSLSDQLYRWDGASTSVTRSFDLFNFLLILLTKQW